MAGSVSVAGRDHDADGDESSAELAHRDVYHPVRFDLHQAPNLTLAEEGRKTSRWGNAEWQGHRKGPGARRGGGRSWVGHGASKVILHSILERIQPSTHYSLPAVTAVLGAVDTGQ